MSEPLLGTVLRATVAHKLRWLFRVRVLGLGNIPTGGAVLAGNHQSYADPILLWCVAPRHVHFMAKSELFEHAVFRWGLPRVWAFPVRRGEADRQALTHASTLLKAGELVGIFPEGTRHHQGMGEASGGAAFLAMRTDVPIVPVGISGTDRILPAGARIMRFPRVTISFGRPITPARSTQDGRKERMAAMTVEVMDGIAAEVRRSGEV